MDLNQVLISSGAGIGMEPVLEHMIMQYIPDKLSCVKPLVSWVVSTAWGIGMTAMSGGDWQQATANAVSMAVFAELKHISPLGSDASPAK